MFDIQRILVIKRNTTQKITKINSEFHSNPLKNSSFQHPVHHTQKASNKSKSKQLGHSKGHTVLKNLHRSPETEGRSIRAHSDIGLTSEPPPSLKAASRSVMAGAAEPPSPLVAGASMSQCWQVLMPVGNQGSGVCSKRGEKSKQEQPFPDLSGNTTNLQPLTPSSVAHNKEGVYSY